MTKTPAEKDFADTLASALLTTYQFDIQRYLFTKGHDNNKLLTMTAADVLKLYNHHRDQDTQELIKNNNIGNQ